MPNARFEALDSWRGLCACLVALFHFTVFSHIQTAPLIANAYLFVDFFFVLSGFVIAANYRARLAGGFGIGRFMLLRFGRIYPLHLAVMIPFIAVDAAKDGVGPQLWRAIATNALMLHGLGVNDALWLNFPSWSISAEFAAYMAFAAITTLAGEVIAPWLAVAAAGAGLLLLSPLRMDSTFDFGLARCLYGFSLGVVCFAAINGLPALRRPLGRLGDTAVELIAVIVLAACIVTVDGHGAFAVALPLLFAALVLVFAREGGAVSALLKTRPLLLIGTLSYSVYMVHALVRAVIRAFAMAAEKLSGWSLFVDDGFTPAGEAIRLLSLDRSLWIGDLMHIGLLALTIGLAMLTYRYIEEPGRLWSRARAAGLSPKPAAAE